jgi:hypothetical protein
MMVMHLSYSVCMRQCVQAAFENQELVQLPPRARGSPKVTTPVGYFHGGPPAADIGLVPMPGM